MIAMIQRIMTVRFVMVGRLGFGMGKIGGDVSLSGPG